MNRKIINKISATFILLFTACASTGSGAGLSLMDAVEQTGEKIAGELPKGSRVAIVAFESENDNVSDFVMEELTGALFDRGIEVADRQNLDYVYQELKLQMSGDVSDESAKSIGKFLAADMVITGQLLNIGSTYRYRTSAISVETAVRASVTRLDIKNDTAMKSMVTALANQKTTVKVAKYGVSEDKTPQTAGTFIDRSIMFASRGDYELAIADANEAIRLNPNSDEAYILRGRIYEKMGNYDRAIADYNQAIQLNPNFAMAYSNRGAVYSKMGDKKKAIAEYDKAIQLNPNYAAAYNNRGVAYGEMGKPLEAIEDLDKAIRLNPNFADAYANRAMGYFFLGDIERYRDRIIEDLETALRIDPNNDTAKDLLEIVKPLRSRH